MFHAQLLATNPADLEPEDATHAPIPDEPRDQPGDGRCVGAGASRHAGAHRTRGFHRFLLVGR
jgi:hypothetical protein